MEKYCRVGQVTNDNMAHGRGMMDTTQPEYVILSAFHCHNGCTNVPQCCVIPKLPFPFYCNLLYLQQFWKHHWELI